MLLMSRQRPVARCTHCFKTSRSLARVDQKCYGRNHEGSCPGFFRPTYEKEWTVCHHCEGTGEIENSRRCAVCRGDGWISLESAHPERSIFYDLNLFTKYRLIKG